MVGFLLVALLGGLALAASGTAKKPKAIEERRPVASKESRPKTSVPNAEPAATPASTGAPSAPATGAPKTQPLNAPKGGKESSMTAAFSLGMLPGLESPQNAPAGDPIKLIDDLGKSMKEVLSNPLAKGPRNEITGKFGP